MILARAARRGTRTSPSIARSAGPWGAGAGCEADRRTADTEHVQPRMRGAEQVEPETGRERVGEVVAALGRRPVGLDRLLGDDDRWTNPAAMTGPVPVHRTVGRGRPTRLLADDLVTRPARQTPHLSGSTSRDGWDRARLYGRTGTGLLRCHHGMADTSPARMTRPVSVRSQMTAHNLLTPGERGPALVHAHSTHFRRAKGSNGLKFESGGRAAAQLARISANAWRRAGPSRPGCVAGRTPMPGPARRAGSPRPTRRRGPGSARRAPASAPRE